MQRISMIQHDTYIDVWNVPTEGYRCCCNDDNNTTNVNTTTAGNGITRTIVGIGKIVTMIIG